MGLYRKKPIVIDAFQMTNCVALDTSTWPTWAKDALALKGVTSSRIFNMRSRWYVQTLEGVLRIEEDYWLLRGVKGELYPCKPDIFEETYEEA